jgi:hypothetical protein
MAKKKRSPWLIGCGIGCGAILVIAILFVIASTLFVRSTLSGFNTAVETRAALEERYGEVQDYVPPADGSIAAERLERFLQVREGLAPARERIGGAMQMFDLSDKTARELEAGSFWEKMRFVGGATRNVMGVPAELGSFFEARNQALLDAEMGLGEYTYIYVLAYHSWLGHAPGDRRMAVGVAPDIDDEEEELSPTLGIDAQGRISRRIQGDLVDMLRHQLGAVDQAADAALVAQWRQTLSTEIDTLQDNRFRIPWQDGLPDAIEASLQPHRERLEATYDPRTNEFELLRNRKQGMSIHAE